MNILVLHKSATLCRLVSRTLQRLENADILAHSSGQEAFSLLGHKPAHVLILGADLDDMRGLDFIRHLRQAGPYSSTPTLYLSHTGSHEDVLEALNAGVDSYILLPFNENQFVGKVREALLTAGRLADDRKREHPSTILSPRKKFTRKRFL